MPTLPPIHLTAIETSYTSYMSLVVRQAFDMALEGRSKLSEPLFHVPGFSGRKFRMFLNNLFGLLKDPRYLEIGVFNGGSLLPAIYANRVKATAVDNWSWFGGSPDAFERGVAEFGGGSDVTVLNQSFQSVDFAAIGPFNVMFYDGAHAEDDQADGVHLPAAAMDSTYMAIVDDWNWDHVRRGTFTGLRKAGCRIDSAIEVRTTLQNQGESLPEHHGPTSDWHNGMFAGVITRP